MIGDDDARRRIDEFRRASLRGDGAPTVTRRAPVVPPATPSACDPPPGLLRRAVAAAAVITSPPVDEEMRAIRLAICKSHVGDCCSVASDGRHYCGCCGCPRWHAAAVGSDLEFKCGRTAWRCPRGLF